MMHSYKVKKNLVVRGVNVLILVVMDDALVQSITILGVMIMKSLNPCCNG